MAISTAFWRDYPRSESWGTRAAAMAPRLWRERENVSPQQRDSDARGWRATCFGQVDSVTPDIQNHDPSTAVWRPFVPSAAGEVNARFITEWKAASRAAPPFLSPEFFLETAELTGITPIVAAGRRTGGAAFLPLCRRGRDLCALRSDQSPRFDLAGDAEALPALWDGLLRRTRLDVMVMRSVPAVSPLVRELPRLARRAGCEVAIRPVGRSPYFLLDDFETHLDGKFRRELARRMRKLGEVQLERVTEYDETALDDAFELEASGWKRDAGTAIACQPGLRQFYSAVLRQFAVDRQLALYFLRVQGRRVAVHIAAEDARTYYLMKPGYATDMAKFGVGQMLVLLAAEDARKRGLERFDFLGREGEWKRCWTRSAIPHAEVRIYRKSVAGRVRHTVTERLRPIAGRVAQAIRSARA